MKIKDEKHVHVLAGKKGKRKGAGFERIVAKLLAEWWNGDGSDWKFYRTPMSGGSQLKEGFKLAGDVVTNDPEFPLHIECKNQEGWSLQQLFKKEGKEFWKWWAQTCKECPEERIPVMFVTKNGYPVFVAMHISTWFKRYSLSRLCMLVNYVIVMPWESFAETTPGRWKEER